MHRDCTVAAGVHTVANTEELAQLKPGLVLDAEPGAIVDGTRALSSLTWENCSDVPEFAARCADGVETAVVSGKVLLASHLSKIVER